MRNSQIQFDTEGIGVKVHDFYRRNGLRVHEIPAGVKCPIVVGWPESNKLADDVEPLLVGRNNKYGWLLDDCHVVIDIDLHNPKENGIQSLERLCKDIGISLDDVCRAIVYSPSGGRHYYFRKPADVHFGKVFKDRYPGIDFIAGKGKQVIAANSCHDKYSGIYTLSDDAELVDLPKELLNHLVELTEKRSFPKINYVEPQDRSGDEFNRSEKGLSMMLDELRNRGYVTRKVADYYEFDRPNKSSDSKCSGHVGKKSKKGNYQLTCFSLSDPYFPSGESISLFHAYALFCHNGNYPKAASELYRMGFAEISPLDLSGFMGSVDGEQSGDSLDSEVEIIEMLGIDWERLNSKSENEEIDDEDFVRRLVPRCGLLHDIHAFYGQKAYRRSHVMGMACAVALCETIFGRRIRSYTDLRTNDYNLILATTGSGKEACESTIISILEKADVGGTASIASDVQSGNGLMKAVSGAPAAIWLCDEFGKILQAVLDKKGNQHIRNIGNHLLKLYGKSSGSYSGAAHSDGVRNKVINPSLTVLGLSTSATVFDVVSTEQVADGLIGRIAFWPVQDRPDPREDMDIVEPPEELVARVRNWIEWNPVTTGDYPDPAIIRMSNEAKARWQQHAREINQRMKSETELRAAIWSRVAARTMKLALVHRCSRVDTPPAVTNWDFVLVELADVEWAVLLSNWLARIACGLIRENVYDKSCDKAKKILLKALESHSEVIKRDILRAYRSLTAGDLQAAADELGLETFEIQTGGRPKVAYRRKVPL